MRGDGFGTAEVYSQIQRQNVGGCGALRYYLAGGDVVSVCLFCRDRGSIWEYHTIESRDYINFIGVSGSADGDEITGGTDRPVSVAATDCGSGADVDRDRVILLW